jgi:alpha-beta hydrolase superfamily lysophospholipase
MWEEEVRFAAGGVELAGTLAWPGSDGPYPAVLLLPGAGRVDRDENSGRFRVNALAEIAGFLAGHGAASLRYDKRGVGRSGGDYWSAGFHDRTNDALAAFTWLRGREGIRAERVFILGHSEGAFIAARLAGGGAAAAGVILLSCAAQSGEAVLKWQAVQVARGLRGLNGRLIKWLRIDVPRAQQKQLDKIKRSTRDWYRRQLLVK